MSRAAMTTAPTIAVLTTGRQDWGILRSVCAAIRDQPIIRLDLLVGGMHLSPRYGHTVDLIEADGFEPDAELAWLDDLERPAGRRPGRGRRSRLSERHLRAVPSGCACSLVGDRLETAAAALAATLDRVPIAHLHGGEQTLGAFDDALRHAITKLSHLHLVSSDEHARRVIAHGRGPGDGARRRCARARRRRSGPTCRIAPSSRASLGIPLDRRSSS